MIRDVYIPDPFLPPKVHFSLTRAYFLYKQLGLREQGTGHKITLFYDIPIVLMRFGKRVPESYTKYRSEAHKTLCAKRSWCNFDPQAYYLYGEDQNHETGFKGKALQAVVDSWCKIQAVYWVSSKVPLDM
jgi:hypothetical protein